MKAWKYLLGFLFLASVSVWLAAFSSEDRNLHLIACDVGQGDAILAVYGDIQILTDGGPGNSVLTCLQKYMPFWDREIELVILTHPQLDHYGGLVEVFSRYQVGTFLTNDFNPSTQGLKALENAVGGSGARVVKPAAGTRLRLGMIYLDILHPPDGLNSTKINDSLTISKYLIMVLETERHLVFWKPACLGWQLSRSGVGILTAIPIKKF
ncbi:MAG: internalization-related competence protein ComEC/Rec2 protein [Candidatus Woesebacteria bacterium GW2011_GWA2_44_33]|uniref:Internalization-related competence protein ComEC/Rec2 protein n=1 Tax=Candidatus Woesebacteria bacterium GW2011_GWA2_44_33 TaxID=1618564 RepID=A0A0G1J306_9BACT|nr:MAG: internalization-related competence protein ComEC/Rec2 protein [Candidatus Woesebacteria bacterium GW2011_GWA2_44_33]